MKSIICIVFLLSLSFVKSTQLFAERQSIANIIEKKEYLEIDIDGFFSPFYANSNSNEKEEDIRILKQILIVKKILRLVLNDNPLFEKKISPLLNKPQVAVIRDMTTIELEHIINEVKQIDVSQEIDELRFLFLRSEMNLSEIFGIVLILCSEIQVNIA